ncbi:putative SAM-dependent methyltransferase [Roseovarius sp. MBR-78]|jgi:uncharacterized SAM-dependent methyltransferase|uniref:hypothetical protein n=1 Tax=Roseovarius sp. MBR-78 TaxID=3156460 RepID=UPI003391FF6A
MDNGREVRLIRLTDEMSRLALYPLTRARAETLRRLAGKVAELITPSFLEEAEVEEHYRGLLDAMRDPVDVCDR